MLHWPCPSLPITVMGNDHICCRYLSHGPCLAGAAAVRITNGNMAAVLRIDWLPFTASYADWLQKKWATLSLATVPDSDTWSFTRRQRYVAFLKLTLHL